MACRLFSTKPWSELTLTYCQLNPKRPKLVVSILSFHYTEMELLNKVIRPVLLNYLFWSFWCGFQIMQQNVRYFLREFEQQYEVISPYFVWCLTCKQNETPKCLGGVPKVTEKSVVECICVRSRRCGCLVAWFCYHLIAKLGNKTAAPSWRDPDQHGTHVLHCDRLWICILRQVGLIAK